MKYIETPRLILRDFRFSDVADFHEFASDPRVGPDAGWKPHENETQTAQILFTFVQDQNVWAIEEKGSGKMIGTLSLNEDPMRPFADVKALGYAMHPAYWGQGLMAEAVEYVLPYAFMTLGISMVTVCHFPHNPRSRRVIEKCGFVYEGTLRQALRRYDGRRMDTCVYALTKQDYIPNCKEESHE